ncbi:MAG: tRNA adenosine(34) deaminase TadA [Bdellovibrionales bacterium]
MAYFYEESEEKVSTPKDSFWMNHCLDLAKEAKGMGEVPVGAIIVHKDRIVGQAFNRKEIDQNPIAHAELLAIQEASRNLGRWRLSNCTLYVTLEPCIMCTGAIIQSRVERVVYGTPDAKAGAIESVYKVFEDNKLNHKAEVVSGVSKEPSSKILKEFFSELREQKKTSPLETSL